MDEARPSEPTRGVDRRTLIKRAAATGAIAWTAPVILDSLLSPAAAVSGAAGCWRITLTPVAGAPNQACSVTSTVDTTCPVTTTACTPTNVVSGTPLVNFCVTGLDCDNNAEQKVFTIAAGCQCVFLDGNAETNGGSGCTADDANNCVDGTISGGGKTMTFADPGSGNCNWVAWNFIVQCVP